jgi:hypothetical protein
MRKSNSSMVLLKPCGPPPAGEAGRVGEGGENLVGRRLEHPGADDLAGVAVGFPLEAGAELVEEPFAAHLAFAGVVVAVEENHLLGVEEAYAVAVRFEHHGGERDRDRHLVQLHGVGVDQAVAGHQVVDQRFVGGHRAVGEGAFHFFRAADPDVVAALELLPLAFRAVEPARLGGRVGEGLERPRRAGGKAAFDHEGGVLRFALGQAALFHHGLPGCSSSEVTARPDVISGGRAQRTVPDRPRRRASCVRGEERWWRRWESNPRPRDSDRGFYVRSFSSCVLPGRLEEKRSASRPAPNYPVPARSAPKPSIHFSDASERTVDQGPSLQRAVLSDRNSQVVVGSCVFFHLTDRSGTRPRDCLSPVETGAPPGCRTVQQTDSQRHSDPQKRPRAAGVWPAARKTKRDPL